MGCWNESCMVTGLPIMYQQECAVVLLTESLHKNRTGHVTSVYAPIFIITGNYNDYGGLEPDPKNEPKLELLQKILHVKTDQPIADWFNQLIIKGTSMPTKQFALDDKDTIVITVQAVFLHKAVLDMARENARFHNLTPLLTEIRNTADAKQNAKDSNTEELIDWQLTKQISRLFDFETVVNFPAKIILNKLVTCDTTISIPMLKQLVELNIVLEDLRKAWHIPSGRGSQESVEPAQNLFLKLYETLLNTIFAETWE